MKTITKAVSVLFLGSVLCLAETWERAGRSFAALTARPLGS